jgi:hypothetical protein
MSLPKPINWLRGSREATGEIYLVRMIDTTAPTGSLGGVKTFYEQHGFLEEFNVGIFTADKLERVRNEILTRMLEVNPDLTAEGNSPNLVWSKEEEDPDYWELFFIPKGQQSGKSPNFGTYSVDYFIVAECYPFRINESHLGKKPTQL